MLDMKNLDRRLRLLRIEKGLTLKELALETGLSLPFLSEIERGVSNPSLESIEKIARVYKITPAKLLTY